MDTQEIRTLKILEEIDKQEGPSQRYLAGRLNVSLGLINSFIKRLAQKGYFKITTIPRNRIKYILTPKGAAEKTRLTYLYIQHSLEFYKTARQKLRRMFQDFTDQGISKIVFYGATDLAEIAYISLQETAIELIGVVDDQKSGEKLIWGEVKNPGSLSSMTFDIILITMPGEEEAVREKLLSEGIEKERISILE